MTCAFRSENLRTQCGVHTAAELMPHPSATKRHTYLCRCPGVTWRSHTRASWLNAPSAPLTCTSWPRKKALPGAVVLFMRMSSSECVSTAGSPSVQARVVSAAFAGASSSRYEGSSSTKHGSSTVANTTRRSDNRATRTICPTQNSKPGCGPASGGRATRAVASGGRQGPRTGASSTRGLPISRGRARGPLHGGCLSAESAHVTA